MSAQTAVAAPSRDGISRKAFDRLSRYITTELGIKMPDSKVTLVENRLQRRVRELGLPSVDAYVEYFFAASHEEERQQLVNLITTNKTDFYREPEHFDFLRHTVLPEWMRNPRGSRFQVWSAGCSSGEEPYTLAMVLEDWAEGHPGFDYAILATDISTRVLGRAAEAIYDAQLAEPLPLTLRRKYLLRSRGKGEDRVRVIPTLRQRIGFHQLNLMQEAYPIRNTFDVIFFRNVMIYFDKPTQTAVVSRMASNLAPGGYLMIGHSETLAGLPIPYAAVKASIYRRD